jgi:hypothetical protein
MDEPRGSVNFRPGSNPDHEEPNRMIKADSVHSTPRRTASKISPTEQRADYYFDMEQPLRDLAGMTTVLATISQSPPIVPAGIKREDLVHFLIGHLDLMVQDIFGNYHDRLRETAVRS